jgi:hypothetical protein
MSKDPSATLEFIAGSRIQCAQPVASALPIVRNGPPATYVVFPDGSGIGLPTDQILTHEQVNGAARVSFGGMRFDGVEDGLLAFRRVREVLPEHQLMPERGRLLKLDPKLVTRVLVGGREQWPED